MKGQVGQAEHVLENQHQLVFNEEIGFTCLHYSVAESSKKVTVIVENKLNQPQTVGCKTLQDTALEHEDFKPIDITLVIPALQNKVVEVEIIDDEGWEPDEDFFIYLYAIDDDDKKQLAGDNTKTKVTILDDDKPGILGFKESIVRVKKSQKKAQIIVERLEGTDGEAHCFIKNDDDAKCRNPAKEFQDFLPFEKKLTFTSGVS